MFNIARVISNSLAYNQLPDATTEQNRLNRLVQAHINGENRMIGDFVLTGAALPLGDGSITPVEGFRVTDVEKDGSVFFVVAAVSAEKIWNLMLSIIHLLGNGVQMAVLHVNTKDGKPVDYITDAMDEYALVDIMQEHRNFILNSGTIEVCFFKAGVKLQMCLDACKHFQIHVVDLVPIIDMLHDFDISSKEDIRFFPEGPLFIIFPENGQQELESFLEKLTIVQSNTYDNEEPAAN